MSRWTTFLPWMTLRPRRSIRKRRRHCSSGMQLLGALSMRSWTVQPLANSRMMCILLALRSSMTSMSWMMYGLRPRDFMMAISCLRPASPFGILRRKRRLMDLTATMRSERESMPSFTTAYAPLPRTPPSTYGPTCFGVFCALPSELVTMPRVVRKAPPLRNSPLSSSSSSSSSLSNADAPGFLDFAKMPSEEESELSESRASKLNPETAGAGNVKSPVS
mmetsp:Transcript_22927/g.56976  ORF Transcript_22927/g.56976 Transcript_22927/m.56976 type:complete len:220 (+) Transcript_22927:1044-1703(+)